LAIFASFAVNGFEVLATGRHLYSHGLVPEGKEAARAAD